MILVIMSFLNEKGYIISKMSNNYGVYFLLVCTVNHVLKKTSKLPLCVMLKLIFLLDEYYKHLDVFCCILLLKC